MIISAEYEEEKRAQRPPWWRFWKANNATTTTTGEEAVNKSSPRLAVLNQVMVDLSSWHRGASVYLLTSTPTRSSRVVCLFQAHTPEPARMVDPLILFLAQAVPAAHSTQRCTATGDYRDHRHITLSLVYIAWQ
ncbi:hypothetical protein ACN38_g7785 [Penicillium nordicum]|uniref:Uncharacterized protein n=1 Tax=Penicillium nordicum TaxID=229535 RepID=A0A0N0RYF3_9EURO|nr:hypothetical protein ACN38_g7785 [Penicillium nordicum]